MLGIWKNDLKEGRQNFSRENVDIFVWCARTEAKFWGEMTKKGRHIFPRKCGNLFDGPPTETKFVKWSASRKRLRTAELDDSRPTVTVFHSFRIFL